MHSRFGPFARACTVALTIATVAALAAPSALAAQTASPQGVTPAAPSGLTATVSTSTVNLAWHAESFSPGVQNPQIQVWRDGSSVATLPGSSTSYQDGAVATGQSHAYYLTATGTYGTHSVTSAPSATVTVTLPAYLVGAATEDISPPPGEVVNQGGFGLGDGTFFPQMVIGRGGQNTFQGEHIRARAMVVDDGNQAIAIADIETQGMFAAYEAGPWGLSDMAARVAHDIPGLPADHILIASDHTHAGPDTIGAWGGVADTQIPGYSGSNQYFHYIFDRTVTAIESAYAARRFANLRAGESNAPDLIYNQSCSEALNQSKQPAYSGPDLCTTPGKDGMMRVLQATAPDGTNVLTYMAYAAHATAGGGPGIHGDWPQFLSDALTAKYGGTGIAMEGAIGGTQPCRPACSFTDPNNPGYNVGDRRTAYTLNYMAHVADALNNDSTKPVTGPVRAARSFIREPITGPAVTGLFTAGQYMGTRLLRSHESPWVVGMTIRTIASALRVGDVLFAGTPGEGFYAIGQGVRDAVGARLVFQLGLANDQLGYLIAPVSYVPVIAAEVAVNDNIIFNVSPTIGDHVMCSDIRLALSLGFSGSSPAYCAPYNAEDAAGDPLENSPVGGVVLPDGLPLP